MTRSSIAAASGRPAPRKAPTGVVFVRAAIAEYSSRGTSYTPVAIILVGPSASIPPKPA